MKCGKDGTARQLELFSLDPLEEDPVGQQAKATIQIGSSAPKKSDTRGPIAADCYDVGQDLLAFVHARRSSLVVLLAASRSYSISQCIRFGCLVVFPSLIDPASCGNRANTVNTKPFCSRKYPFHLYLRPKYCALHAGFIVGR
ncbi:hypothetical protein M408DRAFT_260517 [Serendipita vermifera MAFF 305830]|uniref:Uncharacterized protein n=1 Tax=Serendipita vermifera MAFF 305830 TaxID=933852 RepID=A0A0C3BH39_SERVB|nr:hypothetical protein M408DRAFT_260517 [Serendipita vermifera MAFF 305830]